MLGFPASLGEVTLAEIPADSAPTPPSTGGGSSYMIILARRRLKR